MMGIAISTGASSAKHLKWPDLKWSALQKQVFRLQVRIAKAEREGKRGRVRALQRLLTCSFSAKCLAVKRVTSSSGSRTHGVDNIVWNTNTQKTQAIFDLKRRGYTPQPLRRIYIQKKLGSKTRRPLSIPCMIDRAQQALHLQSLEPLVEEWADSNAYGFRLKRSTQDAMEQCFKVLSTRNSATWILEGDIRKCFDTVSHSWLENNIPMDKVILRKFLKAGVMEHRQFFPTKLGCPQGSPISPALMVMTLAGLEAKLLPAKRHQKEREKINVISYADDFIVTAVTQEILKERILPVLITALKEVGLELSMEKTKITKIEDGFDFLGFYFRKYKGKLLIKPSKANVKKFLKEIKLVIKKGKALPTDKLISTLNSRLTGWVNYYRSSVASKVFVTVDSEIFHTLIKWCIDRHNNKGKPWIIKKYFTKLGGDNWRFHCETEDKTGKQKLLYLKKASDTKIRRHIKIRSAANPFDPQYKEYFAERSKKERRQHFEYINDSDSAGLRIIQSY